MALITDTLFVIPTNNKYLPLSYPIWKEHGEVQCLTKNSKPLLEALLSVRPLKDNIKYVICTHDDVILRDNDFDKVVGLAFRTYDYWGVAGTNMMPVSDPRWHVPFGNKKYTAGLMEHQDPQGRRFMSFYGSYPNAVTIFDGVFMAFKREVFDKLTNVPELNGFHMYDLEMCTQAYDMGYKGGVAGLHLFHESRGEGILSGEWDKYSKVYSQKWSSKYKVIGG